MINFIKFYLKILKLTLEEKSKKIENYVKYQILAVQEK